MTDDHRLPDGKIKITPKNARLTRTVWSTYGAAEVLDALREIKGPPASLPGFALAIALAEKVVADNRAQLAGDALRAAAKAGADIGNSKNVFTSVEQNEVVLTVEPMDLISMAEEPHADRERD